MAVWVLSLELQERSLLPLAPDSQGHQNLLWELMYSGDLPGPRGRASS